MKLQILNSEEHIQYEFLCLILTRQKFTVWQEEVFIYYFHDIVYDIDICNG
jgi:hypothetical protein